MRKVLVAFIILMMLIPTALATGVSIEFHTSPEILLPGDYADGYLKIINPGRDIRINSVVFHSEGLEIYPKSYRAIGTIPSGGSYTLPFSIKAQDVGRHLLEAIISTGNGTIIQHILIVVDDSFPSIVLLTPIYKGEVNELKFLITSPVTLQNVKVTPLFNAEPDVIFVGTVNGYAEGSLKFIPTDEKELKFKLTFYNGKNYHEMIKTIPITFLESKGVMLNVVSSYSSVYVGDCIPLNVEITNLRNDNIYKAVIDVRSRLGVEINSREVAKLGPCESKTITFMYCPTKAGEEVIEVLLKFQDEFGNELNQYAKLELTVHKDLVLSLTNVEIKRENFNTVISGDVSNNGRSKAYNVYVVASCSGWSKDFFLGNIDQSDFQSFNFETKCNGSVDITVKWSNEIGQEYTLTKSYKVPVERVKAGKLPVFWIGVVILVVVVSIVAFIMYRQIKR